MFSRRAVIQLAIVILFLKGGIPAMCQDTPDENGIYRYMNYSLIIPKDELQQMVLDALTGNHMYANLISWHYSGGLQKYDEGNKWLVIGAENGPADNGYRDAQYGLVIILLNNSNNKDDIIRGVFWLYNMAKDGYRNTEAWLQKVGHTLETARPPDDKLFPYEYARLSNTEIEPCKTGALQGSKKAAWLLGKYYEEIATDEALSEYWYRIGAQNGSPECQYIFGQILSGKEDQYDKIRGKFWLNRAVENGYRTSIEPM